jgi:hypothetical protein
MRGRRITWGDDLGWLSWRWCWWLFSVALWWRWMGSPMTTAVLPLRGVETPVCVFSPLPVCSFYPFFFLLPVCRSRSPCRYPYCFGPFSLNTVGLSLSRSPFLFSAIFFSSFSSFRVVIYWGRGSGVDPASSHRCPCMGRMSLALPRRRQKWPMEVSLTGHGFSGTTSWGGWRLVLALTEHVGGRERKKQTKKNKNLSSLVACPGEEEGGTVPSKTALFRFSSLCFFFLKMHETVSFSPKTRHFI